MNRFLYWKLAGAIVTHSSINRLKTTHQPHSEHSQLKIHIWYGISYHDEYTRLY